MTARAHPVRSLYCYALLLLSTPSVDDAASSAFLAASNDASCLYLKYQIKGETFAKIGSGKSRDGVKENWEEIRKGLGEQQNEPAFVVARNVSQEGAGKVSRVERQEHAGLCQIFVAE
jgi:hypothetical protein